MAPRRAKRGSHGLAPVALFILALVVGFTLAGTGLELAPRGEAHERAARVAAERIALEHPLRPSDARPESPERPAMVSLLADAPHVRLARHATRVRIPSLGIDTEVRPVGYVFEQGALRYDVPRAGAGQYGSHVGPGDSGNLVIAGHVANRSGPAVFRELPKVRIGETVEVFRGEQVFRYLVTELRVVAPEATAVMAQTHDATLTLITCSPAQNFAKRFVVIGKLL